MRLWRLVGARVAGAALASAAVLTFPGALQAQVGEAPEEGQRVILVTGSTSGLGQSVALALAGSGDHVIVHGRNQERGLTLVDEINHNTPGSARFYRADFGSLQDVRALAASVHRDYDRLDVLVNNAGIALVQDNDRRLSEEGHELAFQVNYLAPFLLTDLLLPLLRESAPARVVNVSSIAAAPLDFDDLMMTSDYSGGRGYGQSKLAQVLYTMTLAERLAPEIVRVNALHPATFMDTNMVRSMGATPRATVEEGRDNVLQLINEEDVGHGLFYVDGAPRRAMNEQAYDAEARAQLWAASVELTAAIESQLDAFWTEVSRTVREGDFEGYSATYHPDAVLVSASGSTAIANALAGWEPGFTDTREGRMSAAVDFRLTDRRLSDTTAHETGIFRYIGAPTGGQISVAYVHFEALSVKVDGRWLMVMEYQKNPASEAEWEAAGR